MSKDSIKAMKDQDRHATGDNASHATDDKSSLHGHEHTKPAGDQRAVVDKEEAQHNLRGEFNRGH